MEEKGGFSDPSLEEWEEKLNEEVISLEEKLQEGFLSSSFQEKLKSFIESKEKTLGEEIISDCLELSPKADRLTQTYLKMLENLTKALLKFEDISQLFITMTEKMPLILSSQTEPLEREFLIQDFYKQYQRLKTSTSSSASSETTGEKFPEIEALTEKIIEAVEAKLHEINIKIEENQRILQQLITSPKENLFSAPSSNEAQMQLPETTEIKEEIEEPSLCLINIGKEKFVLPAEVIINVYKVSPKKAKKLVQKPLIKFGQIGSFLNPITKGITGELKEKSKAELENMFLTVLQPETETEGEYHGAVVVKVPDIENYGIIFVNQPLKETIKGKKKADEVETPEGTFPFLDVKSLWLKKQVDFGLV